MHNFHHSKKSFSFIGTMGFAISLMVISVYAFLIEIKPFITGSTTPTARFNILEKTGVKAGLSPYSNKLLLNNCLEAMAGPVGMAQPTSRRKTVLISCQSLAKDITSFMPTHAFAYYIGAFASAELKQYSEFNFQIAASQKTAPNGQWLAQFRVELVEENFEKITSATLSSHKQDLILLYGDGLVERLSYVESSADGRLSLYLQITKMIASSPFTGYGAGSFELAFPLFHQLPVSPDVVWDKAHNTYLGFGQSLVFSLVQFR